MATFLYGTASMVVTTWVISGMILLMAKTFRVDTRSGYLNGVRWVWAELRPFYLPAAGVLIAWDVMTGEILHSWWQPFIDACYLLNWFSFRNIDDDDRWKRRARKVAEKLEQRGSRLVVVPVPAGRP